MKKRKQTSRRSVPAAEFKATCLALMDEVETLGSEIIITKHRRPVAKLSPLIPRPRVPFINRSPGVIQLSTKKISSHLLVLTGKWMLISELSDSQAVLLTRISGYGRVETAAGLLDSLRLSLSLSRQQPSTPLICFRGLSVGNCIEGAARPLACLQRSTDPVREQLSNHGARVLPITSSIAIESTQLPLWLRRRDGKEHRDPNDRFLVATARRKNAVLLTCDELILEYAVQGHVMALDARPTRSFRNKADCRHRSFIHLQPKYIGPGIVAHHVEIVLALGYLARIQPSTQDALAVITRTREHPSQRTHDDTAAANHDRFRIVALGGFVVRRYAPRLIYWQADKTKQRPSSAICRIVGAQLSRSSTVGAQ